MKHLIAPSLLSANFLDLRKEVEMINKSDADWLHLDIMDGVFVPNISFGFPVLNALKPGKACREAFGCASDDCTAGKVHPGSKGVGGTYNERAL